MPFISSVRGRYGAQGLGPGKSPFLYEFTNATFRGITGTTGPSLSSAISALSGSGINSWKNNTSYFNNLNGIQLWTVPETKTYRIVARGATAGASAGQGGRGAKITLDVNLTEGEILRILVGQPGNGTASDGGGGGGTFVVRSPYNTEASIIVIAGGGGGRRTASTGAGIDGNYGQYFGTSGANLQLGLRNNSNSNAAVGSVQLNSTADGGWTPLSTSAGQGGPAAGGGYGDGGAGFFGNGFNDSTASTLAQSFINGGVGGGSAAFGGFGGGGDGQGGNGGGGGGGYTGGSGGHTAGGGGSYVISSATNVSFSVDNNPGPAQTALDAITYGGFVTITKL